MRFPHEVNLQPSRIVKASVLVAHLAAALAFFLVLRPLPGEPWRALLLLGGWAFLLALAIHAWRTESGKRGVCLMLDADGLLQVFERDADDATPCHIAPASAVDLGWALWFRMQFVAPEASAARAGFVPNRRVMLVRANMGPEDWRPLRIWLRHKALRADVVANEPGAGS